MTSAPKGWKTSAYPTRRVTGSCPCGACSFEALRAPQARLICHCTLCQAFTGQGYSDVAIMPGSKVILHNEAGILFRRYKRFRFPPPNLNRGRCRICDSPVVETAGPAAMRLLFLPVANFHRSEHVPRAGVHMFYEHRQADADDDVPKRCGYFPSQRALVGLIAKSL
jgi:hypothetical protein